MLYRPQHRRQISNRGAWYLTKQPYERNMFAVEKTPSTSGSESHIPSIYPTLTTQSFAVSFLGSQLQFGHVTFYKKSLEMFEIKRNENTNSIRGKVFGSVKVPCQEKVLQTTMSSNTSNRKRKEVNDVGEVNLQLCLVSLVSWEICMVWWQVGMNPFDF